MTSVMWLILDVFARLLLVSGVAVGIHAVRNNL